MNIAEASAALAKKDNERAALREARYKLQAEKQKGYVGELSISVLKVDNGIPDTSYQFTYQCLDRSDEVVIQETDKSDLREAVVIPVTSKCAAVRITAYFTASASAPVPVKNGSPAAGNSAAATPDSIEFSGSKSEEARDESEESPKGDEGNGKDKVGSVAVAAVDESEGSPDGGEGETDVGGYRIEDITVLQGSTAHFTCSVLLEDLPESGELRAELPGSLFVEPGSEEEQQQDRSAPACHVKVSMDSLASALHSLDAQLAEVQVEFEQLYAAVQQASQAARSAPSSGSGSADKSPKKKKASASASAEKPSGGSSEVAVKAKGKSSQSQQEGAAPTPAYSASSSAASVLEVGVQMLQNSAALCVEQRAFLLFGAAALAIFLAGDYASV